MKNPYQAKFKRPAVVASELKFGGNTAIGRNGEVNAWNKSDLAKNIARLMEVASTQGVQTEETAAERAELATKRREMVNASFTSPEAHKELGATLADELYIAGKRDGFMRRLLTRQEVNKGSVPNIWMRLKNVVAVVASSPSQLQAQLIRDNLYYPPEFYIEGRPFVEQRMIEQSATDVLEEKYIEALEAFMVAEDRLWYRLATGTVNIANPYTNISGQLTANTLSNMRTLVNRWNIPASNLLLASDIWNDIISEPSFRDVIDPVSKHELLLTGQIGTIFGMTVYTDGFRHPQHRVFNQGDVIVVGDAQNHGSYTDRGGINSQPIDGTHEKMPGRGWYLTQLMSMLIANARSVAKGNRA